jgi:hypothetical protein
MKFTASLHHILATGSLAGYAARIAALYAPEEFNPFDSDNTFNKVLLTTDAVLAQVLQQASALPA